MNRGRSYRVCLDANLGPFHRLGLFSRQRGSPIKLMESRASRRVTRARHACVYFMPSMERKPRSVRLVLTNCSLADLKAEDPAFAPRMHINRSRRTSGHDDREEQETSVRRTPQTGMPGIQRRHDRPERIIRNGKIYALGPSPGIRQSWSSITPQILSNKISSVDSKSMKVVALHVGRAIGRRFYEPEAAILRAPTRGSHRAIINPNPVSFQLT